jgi:hypothetical protein
VQLDTSYLSNFAVLATQPAAVLPDLIRVPGDSAVNALSVVVELRAASVGLHRGEFLVHGAGETLRIPLRTRIFP